MQRRRLWGGLLAGLLTAAACTPEPPSAPRIRVAAALGEGPADGFARALGPRRFVFPADHGPHPDYRNEWWYLTGNLSDDAGHQYGFQVTWFRIGLQADAKPRASRWATRQVWMAHAALSDLDGGRHLAAERFARDALGLAGARADPLRVWLEDWSLSASGSDFPWHLQADAGRFALDLDLSALRAPVLQGEDGLSRKSAQPGNASYYYSITRLGTRGHVRIDGTERPVSGLSWLDREWGTSALAADQVGWDWLALQLADGTDFMYYRLRRSDGSTAPESTGMLLGPDGARRPLTPADLALDAVRFWSAPDGARYPIAWSVLVRPLGRRWRVEAALDDQLMDLGVRYWEGAVRVLDPASGELLGRGYLELAGYEPPRS